ncbi:histone H1-like repetitive region-containing protein [Desulfosarcina cetonica]
MKDLLKRQFDSETPQALYTVPQAMRETSVFSAPEFLAGLSTEDAKRVKGLLANTYSAEDLKAAAKVPPPSRAELIQKKFDVVVPETLYTVPQAMVEASAFTAPDRLAGLNADEAKRVKALLANTYSEADLKAAAEKAAAEKAAAEKAAAEKAAAEKAAAEKAAAEKAAAEKAAAEKAAAEKAAAEKAAAEKAAAEKAAAEKAAAEKAAAEKAAAEKAAAEKAAAEKAAAEKAAAEKAAAEKAAAEKAAAEKAAAEKAAAEKAAAEKAEAIKKAAAQQSEVEVSYDAEPPKPEKKVKKPSDPMDTTIKLIAAGVAFFMILIVGASISNSLKYYLVEKQGALQIWKGKFAPLGKKRIAILPGVPAPEEPKAIYSQDEVYPLAYEYFIDKADALMDVSGIPDFEGIQTALKTALEFSASDEMQRIAFDRLDTIDRLTLTYKADLASSRGTIEGFQTAIGLLNDAGKLTSDKVQKEMIAQRIAAHEAAIETLTEQTAENQPEVENSVPAVENESAAPQATEPEAETH